MSRVVRLTLTALSGLLVLSIAVGCHSQEARPPSGFIEPSAAELNAVDRRSMLPGTWRFIGTYAALNGVLHPAEAPFSIEFSASGDATVTDDAISDVTRYHWTLDPNGRLDLKSDRNGGHSLPGFFFRDGYLYLEGDTGWEKYQRQ